MRVPYVPPMSMVQITIAALLTATGFLMVSARAQTPAGEPPSAAQCRTLVKTYCYSCHNSKVNSGGLDLTVLDPGDAGSHAREWESVVSRLRVGMMPPAGTPRPEGKVLDGFRSYLEKELDRAWLAHPNPGRTEALHRLNRTEYQNAVRDLLALDIPVADLLPEDDSSNGFDNMAGTLRMSQSLMERYLFAAKTVARLAVGSASPGVDSKTFRVRPDLEQYEHIEGLPFGTRGGMTTRYTFPREGDYDVRVDLSGTQRLTSAHQFEISLDGEQVKLIPLEPSRAGSTERAQPRYTVRVHVTGGPHDVTATFFRKPADLIEQFREPFENPQIAGNDGGPGGPAPTLAALTIIGPYNDHSPGETPSRHQIFSCYPSNSSEENGCAQSIISRLSRRAYRAGAAAADVDSLMSFYRSGRTGGGTFEGGIELALRKMLVTPAFLFRLEADPVNPADRAAVRPAAIQRSAAFNYRLGSLELASRLSFFLWSSIPDDALLTSAEKGLLTDPQEYGRQLRRMTADRRSDALSTNFADEWLQLRNLETVQPSFPYTLVFDETLRRSMRKETELLFDTVLRENRSAIELLTANYTFVDQRLAKHYGIPNIQGTTFRRVELAPDSSRRGLLGQASILTITSHPNRTSPVLRGKFLLKNLLGSPPSDPPPNIPALPEPRTQAKQQTMRTRMAVHRSNPACASCHNVIDPAGFALESFDATGRFRTKDESYNDLDTTGAFPDGTSFSNVAELRTALTRNPEPFINTLTQKLMTYALGRGLEYYDMPAVRKVVRDAAPGKYKLSELITGIVNSPPFLMRRAEPIELAPSPRTGPLAQAKATGLPEKGKQQ